MDYFFNGERTVSWFASQGIRLFRIPFRWERLQPVLGKDLNRQELVRLRCQMDLLRLHGARAVLDLHNYGRYSVSRNGRPIQCVIDGRYGGEVPVTRHHLADVWVRISRAFRNDTAVEGYGLMNEPHDLGSSDWRLISQEVVTQLRADGDNKRLLVAGDQWSKSETFAKHNGSTAWIMDELGNTTYEAHCYFDLDGSGKYRMSYEQELERDPDLPNRGLNRVTPFLNWCAENRVRGFLGEFGVPSDPRWLAVLESFLGGLDAAGMESCYWAAGEYWGNHPLSIQPRQDFGMPAPQLQTLMA